MLLEKLKALECSLHGTRRNNRKWLEQILHYDFHEITKSGVMVSRIETIESLVNEKDKLFIQSSDYHLIKLAEDCVILYYKTFHPEHGTVLRSSIWVYYNKTSWMLAFHQGTKEKGFI